MENSRKELSFEPITSGLGFHPFSDGLPYAPITPQKAAAARPAWSAVPAGPVQIAMPATSTIPVMRVPVVPVFPNLSNPANSSRLVAAPKVSVPVTVEKSETQVSAQLEPIYGFAYLAKRMAAYFIESVLNFGIFITALSVLLVKNEHNYDLLLNPALIAVLLIFGAMWNWALITGQELAFGTSIGKRIFGLKITGSTSAILLRAFYFLPSTIFCGIGELWSLFDRKKRCWHDLASGVQPVETA